MPPHLLPPLLVPLCFAGFVALEARGRGPVWPETPGWRERTVLGFLMLAALNASVSAALPDAWRRVHLLDLSGRPLPLAAAAGYLALSLGNAGLHYAYHRSETLWRWVHRLHHAPPRLDAGGVMYQTPLEGLANALLFQAVSVLLLGLSAEAAAWTAFVGAFYGLFQHLNHPTPRWVGWLIQRPEAHALHHLRGRHDLNYSDLPLWDALAGTFRNPAEFPPGPLGFAPEVAAQEAALCGGRALDTPRAR